MTREAQNQKKGKVEDLVTMQSTMQAATNSKVGGDQSLVAGFYCKPCING